MTEANIHCTSNRGQSRIAFRRLKPSAPVVQKEDHDF